VAFTALAFAAEDGHTEVSNSIFDTNDALVGIDNQASACMSDDINDFVGPLMHTNRIVKGFARHRTAKVQKGTIEWKWEDDNGKVTTHRIPNSYYIPDRQA
jgi:hypothetical protein